MTFLKDDRERANKELDCYIYCLDSAFRQINQENYAKAAAYYENIARSMRELERMKIAKQTFDKSWFEIKQIEGQQHVDRTVAEWRSRL